MRILFLLLISLFFSSCETINDNNPVNDLSGVTVIKITAEEDDIINLFNNRFTNLEIPVKINLDGIIHSGTAEAAGAGSRYYPKFGFRIKLNNTTISGLSEFSLSSQPADPTYIKTAIASRLYEEAGFPVFYSEPVFVTVNNRNYGLYNMVERIDPHFFYRRNLTVGELYKVQFQSKFTFNRENNLEANFDKEIPKDGNYSSLAALIRTSDETIPEDIPSVMSRYMDIENYLWYHAVSTIRSDPDSYSNNFYIYSTSVGVPFMFLPWDFDRTFTGEIGLYGSNELIESLIRNDEIFASYKNKLRHIIENSFAEEQLFPLIDNMYSKLEQYYEYDPLLTNKDIRQETEYLKNFITLRRTEMMELLEYGKN
jgi:spore coat protein CotH